MVLWVSGLTRPAPEGGVLIKDEFLAQFGPATKLKRRIRLVVHGASRRGKTEFAKRLVLGAEMLEVNSLFISAFVEK